MPATLTFDDEFDNLSLYNGSTGTWDTTFAYRPFDSNGASLAGNGEQEWYINANYGPTASVQPWTVANGVLTLTAAKVDPSIAPLLGFTDPGMPPLGSYQYTSGMIETNHSFSQTYGYFEMKAELPAGQGFWPAFWLVRQDGAWPPELDVMEVLGKDPSTLYTTVHSNETGTHTQSGLGSFVGDMSKGFHTFAVDWEPDKITWYFDNKPVYQVATPADMNAPMFMIANLAVGGYWPGNADATTPFPAQMQIDYIRAWNANPYSYTPEGSTGPGLTYNALANTVVAGGGGDDQFVGSIAGGETLTGGSGHDTFVYNSIPWVGDRITDFQVGSDKLDLHALYPTYTGSDPMADGYVVIAADGQGGYNVLVNPDGHATAANPYPTLVVKLAGVTSVGLTSANLLVNTAAGQTAASTFSTSNVFQVAADGTATWTVSPPPPPPPPPASPPPPPSFVGTAGADTLTATQAGGETMTGAGSGDAFAFGSIPWVGDDITDFTPGVDRLDFSALFAASGYAGTDPLADGYVTMFNDAAGVWLRFDKDGPGTADQWGTNVVHLDGLSTAGLTSASLFGIGASPPPPPPPVAIVNVDPPSLPLSGAPTNTVSSGRNGVLSGTRQNDLLDGHGQYHSMSGGAGDDTYAVYLSSDVVTEKAGAGIDTVWSSAPSYTLAANVENGVLKGTGPQSLTGNGLNNDLRANDAASTLNGGAGNDILHAGKGAVTLTGGAGADVFEFSKLPTAAGHVTDFTPGSDVLDLRGLFAAAAYQGVNPLADGHIAFTGDGAGGAQVWFDADGSAGLGVAVLVTTLDHVSATALTPGVDWVFG